VRLVRRGARRSAAPQGAGFAFALAPLRDTTQAAHDLGPVVYLGSESARARYVSDRQPVRAQDEDPPGTILAYLAELNNDHSGSGMTSKSPVYLHSTSARSTLSNYIASRYCRYS